MELARDFWAFLRWIVWFGIVGGFLRVLDFFDVYEHFVKGGWLDPTLWAEPWAGWAKWVTTTVDVNLIPLLVIAASLVGFMDERKKRRKADADRDKANDKVERIEADMADLRGLYDGLVARSLEEMWDRRKPATETKQPEDKPEIVGGSIPGTASSTDSPEPEPSPPKDPRSPRRSRRDPPDQPPLPGF